MTIQHCEILGKHACGRKAVAWVKVTWAGYNNAPMSKVKAACPDHRERGMFIEAI